MKLSFKMDAGRSTLAINGITAPLRNAEDEAIAWRVVKLALFDKNPQRAIARLLRST